MTNLVETPLQSVKVTIPVDDAKKVKTETAQPTERTVTMKILTE